MILFRINPLISNGCKTDFECAEFIELAFISFYHSLHSFIKIFQEQSGEFENYYYYISSF